jgi:hypothetical protein
LDILIVRYFRIAITCGTAAGIPILLLLPLFLLLLFLSLLSLLLLLFLSLLSLLSLLLLLFMLLLLLLLLLLYLSRMLLLLLTGAFSMRRRRIPHVVAALMVLAHDESSSDVMRIACQ